MSVDPLTMQKLLQSIPEINRQRRRAQGLQSVSDVFGQMAQAPAPQRMERQQGAWFPTVEKFTPDHSRLGRAAANAASIYFGQKAQDAQTGVADSVGQQSMRAMQQMSGGEGDNPTAAALRGYLGIIGGPDAKNITGMIPRVQSTKVDENGNIIAIMSDNSVVDTGRKADYSVQNMETGDGRVVSVGRSGAGRGVARQVYEAIGIPMDQVTPEGGDPMNIESNIPGNERDAILREYLGLGPNDPLPNMTTQKNASVAEGMQPLSVATPEQRAAQQARGKIEAEAALASQIAQTAGAQKLAEEQAKSTAEAQANLGSVENITNILEKAITDLENAEGLSSITGNSLWARAPDKLAGLVLPAFQAGTPAADAYAKYQHLQGGNFLQAFQSLKGGGQITEKEGEKAEQAFGRLSRAQSDQEFRAALRDLKNLMVEIRTRARSKAGGRSTPAASSRPALPAGFQWED